MATTTPNYGWSVPTSTDYVAQGAVAIETLGDSVDSTLFTALGGAYPGLRLVKKQTVGTGVSSVTVTGAFSATYENYKVIWSNGVGSTGGTINLTLGGSTSLYYHSLIYSNYGTSTVTAVTANGTASWLYNGSFSTTGSFCEFELFNPFNTRPTGLRANFSDLAGGASVGTVTGFLNNTNSHTAFTIGTNGGTITGGTIYVYGYGAS